MKCELTAIAEIVDIASLPSASRDCAHDICVAGDGGHVEGVVTPPVLHGGVGTERQQNLDDL